MAEEQTGVTLTPDQVEAPPPPDDGLDDAERQMFQDMQQGKGIEVPDAPPGEPAAGEEPPAKPEVKAGETPAEDDDGEDDEAPKVDPKTGKPDHRRRVNYIRHKKLEERFSAVEAERNQLKETVARFDERLKIVNDALATVPQTPQQEAAQEADPMPDINEDLFGFVQWQGREFGRQLERVAQAVSGTQQHISTTADQEAYLRDYSQSVQRYAATEPLIPVAYQHLVWKRGRELEMQGVTSKEQRDKIVQEEERGLYDLAKKQGRDPADVIWKMALERGFTKDNPVALWGLEWDPATMTVKQPAQNGAAAATNGAAAASRPAASAPAAVAAAAPSVSSVIAGVKNGQSSALSLSNGGGVPSPVLTPQMLAEMPDAEFAALCDRLTPKQKQELFGQ